MLAGYSLRWKCLISENRFERYAFAGTAGAGLRVGPEISKIPSNLIGAATCARLAYFVDIGTMTMAIGVIRLETLVRDGHDQHAVTVNVDAA